MLYSFYASAVAYYIPAFSYGLAITVPEGKTDGFWVEGVMTFSTLIICHHFLVYLETRHFTKYMIGFHIVSILMYFPIMIFLDDAIEGPNFNEYFMTYGKQPQMLFGLLLSCTLIVLPYYGIRAILFEKTKKDLGKTSEEDKNSDGSGN